jgi:hypothetical protein
LRYTMSGGLNLVARELRMDEACDLEVRGPKLFLVFCRMGWKTVLLLVGVFALRIAPQAATIHRVHKLNEATRVAFALGGSWLHILCQIHPDTTQPRQEVATRLRIAGIVLRSVFLCTLLVLTVRVSLPQCWCPMLRCPGTL